MLAHLFYSHTKSDKCAGRYSIRYYYCLQQYISFDDNGVKPIRASGTRWVSYKMNTCLLSKFDVYINHLATIIEDSSTKALDKTKLKGCYIKWTNAKYLL